MPVSQPTTIEEDWPQYLEFETRFAGFTKHVSWLVFRVFSRPAGTLAPDYVYELKDSVRGTLRHGS